MPASHFFANNLAEIGLDPHKVQVLFERAAREVQEEHDHALADKLAEARNAREALRSEIAVQETRLQQFTTGRDDEANVLHAARTALESLRIERRNADLELQRMTLLVAETVDANIASGGSLFPAPPRP